MSDVSENFSRRTRALGAALKAVVVGAVIGALILMVVLLLDGEEQRNLIEEQNARILAFSALTIECTTPPEERHPPVKLGPRVDDCFLRTQRQAARAVGEIGNLSTIAAACGAANPGNIPKTRECVDKAIEEFPPVPREDVPE